MGGLHVQAAEVGLEGPAMVIIGDVVKLHSKLEWFAKRDDTQFGMSVQAQDTL